MAHNLYYNENTQKHSFFSVREKALHSLGTIIEDFPTSAEAIVYAGLNYTVEKRPLFTLDNQTFEQYPNTNNTIMPNIPIPNYFATMRTDTQEILGVVGKDYQVVQNAEAFTFFDSIVDGNSGVKYETPVHSARGSGSLLSQSCQIILGLVGMILLSSIYFLPPHTMDLEALPLLLPL